MNLWTMIIFVHMYLEFIIFLANNELKKRVKVIYLIYLLLFKKKFLRVSSYSIHLCINLLERFYFVKNRSHRSLALYYFVAFIHSSIFYEK